MSTPVFPHFFCPHCNKRFLKNDPPFAGAALHLSLMTAAGMEDPFMMALDEHVNCPNPQCGKPIPLRGIYGGKFDSPKPTVMGCILTILFFIVAIIVFNVIHGYFTKPH